MNENINKEIRSRRERATREKHIVQTFCVSIKMVPFTVVMEMIAKY